MNYIIIIAAIIAVGLYWIVGEIFRRHKDRLFIRRLIIGTLIVALLVSQIDIIDLFTGTVEAAETEKPGVKTIVDFAELPEEIREQTVSVGTALEELILPKTLEAVCAVEDAAGDESGKDMTEGDTENAEPGEEDGSEQEITDNPGDNPEADIPEDEDDGAEAESPAEEGNDPSGENPADSEGSTVGEASGEKDGTDKAPEDSEESKGDSGETSDKGDGISDAGSSADGEKSADEQGEVTDAEILEDPAIQVETFSVTMPAYQSENVVAVEILESGSLSENTVEQPSENNNQRPETKSETSEKTVMIENIMWQSEPEYDGDIPGEYIFTAILPDSYALTKGVNIPQITVKVREPENIVDIEETAKPEQGEKLKANLKIAANVVPLADEHSEHDGINMAWEEDDELPAESDSYYLTTDVTISGGWATPSGITNLCLNGHDIVINGMIEVESGSTLNIFACNGGSIKGAAYGIYNSGTLSISNGTVSGNTYGIYNDGKFNLSGSPNITGSKAGIYLASGKYITVTGSLTGISSYSVSTEIIPQKGTPVQITDSSTKSYNVEDKFTSADSSYVVKKNSDSQQLELAFPIYTVTITPYKDDVEWKEGDVPNNFRLISDDGGGIVTNLRDVPNGTYQVYVGNTYTGETVKVDGSNATVIINYYTVTFKDGQTSLEKPEPRIVLKGSTIRKPSDIPTKEGHTFSKWVTADEKEYSFSSPVTKRTDLYASWEAETYTVSYYEISGETITVEEEYRSYTYGVGLILPKPTKEGYIFEGWYTDKSFKEDTLVTSVLKTETGNKTFYAKWTKEEEEEPETYTVTYLEQDGEEITVEEKYRSYTYGVGLKELPEPTKEGYIFEGWYTDKSFKEDTLVTSVLKTETGNKTFYAKWTKEEEEEPETYTVTYYEQDGREITVGTEYRSYTYRVGLTLPRLTKEGYTFDGWYTNASLTGKAVTRISETDKGNMKFYAKWTKVDDGGDEEGGGDDDGEEAETYTVKYHTNGGKIANESKYTSYIVGKGLTLPKPTKSGYIFKGWYTNDKFTGNIVMKITEEDTGDKEFYAKWEEKPVEDKQDDNTDSSTDESSDAFSDGGSGTGNGSSEDTGTDTDPSDDEQTDEDTQDDEDSGVGEDDEDGLSAENTGNDSDTDEDSEEQDDQFDDNASDKSAGKDRSAVLSSAYGTVGNTVQAGLKNGEIVIGGGTIGSAGATTDGNDAGTGEAAGRENADTAITTGTIEGADTASTAFIVGEGAVIVTIVSDEYPYGAGVADTVAVANAVLTPKQKQLVNSGQIIEIRIDVREISGQISQQDKDVITEGLKDGRAGLLNLAVDTYIDISMYIRAGEGEWYSVTQIEKPIAIVLGIPDALQSDEGMFYVARSHAGKYALLDDLDNKADTVTIKTNLFSAYAIVYQQMLGAGEADTADTAITESAVAYFVSHLWVAAFIWLMSIPILLGIIIVLLINRRKEEKKLA